MHQLDNRFQHFCGIYLLDTSDELLGERIELLQSELVQEGLDASKECSKLVLLHNWALGIFRALLVRPGTTVVLSTSTRLVGAPRSLCASATWATLTVVSRLAESIAARGAWGNPKRGGERLGYGICPDSTRFQTGHCLQIRNNGLRL
jgi:hypothetical protein